MKRFPLLLAFLLCAAALLSAESRWAFKGTVVRMKTAKCMPDHSFLANMSGSPVMNAVCPQYTVMGSGVVYVVVGKKGDEFIPLAKNIDFSVHKNEIVLYGSNEKIQSRFIIKSMTLRSQWEHEQALKELELKEKLERNVRYRERTLPQPAIVMAAGVQ